MSRIWPIPESAIAAARAHAAAAYPRECCGLVVKSVYLPQENLAAADDEFEIADEVMTRYWDDVDAVVHSHCYRRRELGHRTNPMMFGPSASDMIQQSAQDLPWGIVPVVEGEDPKGPGIAFPPYFWGDCLPTAPLLGRVFIHGVHDCYSQIRDSFWLEDGIRLPDFPRSFGWWRRLTTGGLYEDGFRRAGFVRIPGDEVRPGDVIIGSRQAKVANHGGRVRENHLFLHHWIDQLSRQEPLGTGAADMSIFLRYQGDRC